MRNGAHCPNSGGMTMVGKSCVSVWVRSMTRIEPAETAFAKARRSGADMVASLKLLSGHVLLGEPVSTSPEHALAAELALERLRVHRQARPDVLGDLPDENILDAFLECIDHSFRQL